MHLMAIHTPLLAAGSGRLPSNFRALMNAFDQAQLSNNLDDRIPRTQHRQREIRAGISITPRIVHQFNLTLFQVASSASVCFRYTVSRFTFSSKKRQDNPRHKILKELKPAQVEPISVNKFGLELDELFDLPLEKLIEIAALHTFGFETAAKQFLGIK